MRAPDPAAAAYRGVRLGRGSWRTRPPGSMHRRRRPARA